MIGILHTKSRSNASCELSSVNLNDVTFDELNCGLPIT